MNQNLYNILEHRLLSRKNKIVTSSLENFDNEDKITNTISTEIAKLFLRIQSLRKVKND